MKYRKQVVSLHRGKGQHVCELLIIKCVTNKGDLIMYRLNFAYPGLRKHAINFITSVKKIPTDY